MASLRNLIWKVRVEIDLAGASMMPLSILNYPNISAENIATQIREMLATRNLSADQVQLIDPTSQTEEAEDGQPGVFPVSGLAGLLSAVLSGALPVERSSLPATYSEDGTMVTMKLRAVVLGQAGARGGARRRSGTSTASVHSALTPSARAGARGAGVTSAGAGDEDEDEDEGEQAEGDEDEGEEAGEDSPEQQQKKKEQGVKVTSRARHGGPHKCDCWSLVDTVCAHISTLAHYAAHVLMHSRIHTRGATHTHTHTHHTYTHTHSLSLSRNHTARSAYSGPTTRLASRTCPANSAVRHGWGCEACAVVAVASTEYKNLSRRCT